ncbi:hypothetical protein [Alkalihalobacterium chitinilyticum]|uniref:Uncharacterized protein n=1 Tax=Alkalihalobacterium chitinilyticum TaxID=2980103 RepID=A0ABT5VB48_9BACI|nr:hypothetical protein [Alkalihalobacterium chitinilyticum]MDE5412699.1 hypothetical protein [Alkalihalobacterium chitinilyticum]
MVSFLILGILVTIGSGVIFYIGLSVENQFLFGPFIGLVVGINFIFMAIVRMYQRKRR